MAARWFLGLAEAGLFPGVNYYLSCWYRRTEFGIRAAIFFSAAALAGSFGGLLAAAIVNMDGIGGKPGWAWIFILEASLPSVQSCNSNRNQGLATIVIGAISFWMVHDFPDEATFLSEPDRQRVIRRLKADKQSSAEHEMFKMDYAWATLKDWKTYTGMLIYMGCDGALYAFSLFIPSIIAGLGYKSTKAQLLSVPPYAVAAVLTVFVGFSADRTRQRGIHNMCIALLGIIGYGMLLGMPSFLSPFSIIKYLSLLLRVQSVANMDQAPATLTSSTVPFFSLPVAYTLQSPTLLSGLATMSRAFTSAESHWVSSLDGVI